MEVRLWCVWKVALASLVCSKLQEGDCLEFACPLISVAFLQVLANAIVSVSGCLSFHEPVTHPGCSPEAAGIDSRKGEKK